MLIGASQCGAVLAGFVARELGVEFTFTTSAGGLDFHRMFAPPQGRAVVFVDDLISSGTDVRAHAAFLQGAGMKLLGVSCWVNRQAGELGGTRVVSLAPAPFALYTSRDCPLCARHVPVVDENVRE